MKEAEIRKAFKQIVDGIHRKAKTSGNNPDTMMATAVRRGKKLLKHFEKGK